MRIGIRVVALTRQWEEVRVRKTVCRSTISADAPKFWGRGRKNDGYSVYGVSGGSLPVFNRNQWLPETEPRSSSQNWIQVRRASNDKKADPGWISQTFMSLLMISRTSTPLLSIALHERGFY